jgi:hypothetical protein
MAKNRISELDVIKVSPLGVVDGSAESQKIDPRYIKIVSGQVIGKYAASSDVTFSDYIVSDEVYEKPGVPHMEDISIVKNSTYVDAKNNVRTQMVFRVKNSSGEPIIGVDARLEVKTGVDQ